MLKEEPLRLHVHFTLHDGSFKWTNNFYRYICGQGNQKTEAEKRKMIKRFNDAVNVWWENDEIISNVKEHFISTGEIGWDEINVLADYLKQNGSSVVLPKNLKKQNRIIKNYLHEELSRYEETLDLN